MEDGRDSHDTHRPVEEIEGGIGIIEEEWMADWAKLQKKQPMKEVESFGMKIRNAGEEYQIPYLSSFGLQIIQAVEAFDIEQIRIQIKEFPGIIEKLKKLL